MGGFSAYLSVPSGRRWNQSGWSLSQVWSAEALIANGDVGAPRSIAALEPEVERLVDEALDRLADEGTVDLVEALAYPLAFTVITRMLGMPEARKGSST